MNIEKIEAERRADRQLMASIAQDGGSLCAGIGSAVIVWREGELSLTASNKNLTPVQCRKLAASLQQILKGDSDLERGFSGSTTTETASSPPQQS